MEQYKGYYIEITNKQGLYFCTVFDSLEKTKNLFMTKKNSCKSAENSAKKQIDTWTQ